MKIGMFTYSTQPRGSVVHAVRLSEALVRAGEQVTLFALSKHQSRLWCEPACDVRLLPVAEAPAELDALIAQRIAELARALEQLAPQLDVLHAQDCLVASGLLEARRRCPALARCPLLRTVHHVERFESRYLAECQRRSIEEADVVLTVSQATDDDLWEAFGRRGLRVGSGVDGARFAGVGARAADVRQALGLPAGAFVVLSVGGVEPRKNSLRCLEAVALARARAPGLFWLCAGGASVLDHRAYRAELEARLAALPPAIQLGIRRTGVLSDAELDALYGASDALLCASEQEGFGLSVLEALAARRPVVVSRRPPFTEYLPERAALFVEPDSAESIAEALLELHDSEPLRMRLAEQGQVVARRHTWERSAVDHRRAYALALERGAPGAPQR